MYWNAIYFQWNHTKTAIIQLFIFVKTQLIRKILHQIDYKKVSLILFFKEIHFNLRVAFQIHYIFFSQKVWRFVGWKLRQQQSDWFKFEIKKIQILLNSMNQSGSWWRVFTPWWFLVLFHSNINLVTIWLPYDTEIIIQTKFLIKTRRSWNKVIDKSRKDHQKYFSCNYIFSFSQKMPIFKNNLLYPTPEKKKPPTTTRYRIAAA